MNNELNELRKAWEREEKAELSGWDFSHIKGRWEEEELPWDYKNTVQEYLSDDGVLLDMGTGGGEFLLELGHPYTKTFVTESYAPNLALCHEKLAPLGIGVFSTTENDRLPFDDSAFDVVINRHESFESREVRRVLKQGGVFITQQVGGENNSALSRSLIDGVVPAYRGWNLAGAVDSLEDTGFEIAWKDECFPQLRFYDVGAVVYFAKTIEWEFPEFSVEMCFERLVELHVKCQKEGFLESREHRFMIIGKNMK